MALSNCPECGLQVSTFAETCPHCGYPLKGEKKAYEKRKKMRSLPKGFGRISKIRNQNLRNPYRAMVTVGFDENGRPIGKLLKPKAYFATYNEAYEALVEYHKDPCSFENSMLVKDLYAQWSSEYFKDLKDGSSIRTIKSAWSYCSAVYNMEVKNIRARHIKECMENGFVETPKGLKFASPNTKERIKSLWNLMLDHALEYELVSQNYARTFKISDTVRDEAEKDRNGHIAFTNEEMDLLWKNKDDELVQAILVMCYSGLRPQELCKIETSKVNINDWSIVAGMKTAAGIDRLIPIHPCIRQIIEEKYKIASKEEHQYLFGKLNYDRVYHEFKKLVNNLNLNPDHRPHDGRKTFITLAKKYKLDEYAIKKICGHKITDITESIYTERDPSWLFEEMLKIEVVQK